MMLFIQHIRPIIEVVGQYKPTVILRPEKQPRIMRLIVLLIMDAMDRNLAVA